MEMESYYKWISPYVEPNDTNESMASFRKFLLGEFARPNDQADYFVMTFPNPRIDYYKESDYDKLQKNVVGYANIIVNALGFFPVSVTCEILKQLQTLSLGLVFIGIIFSVVSLLFIIISVLLIYSLLMITVEEKSFEIGIYRMVGLNKVGLITMVLLKAFFFVLPAIITSFVLSVVMLFVIYRQLFDSAMGTDLVPIPTGRAIGYALGVGILIPIASSLYPLRVVLSKNLTDALDYAHSKTKAVLVKIVHAKNFDKKPYIIFGLVTVLYGISVYYFLPLSLISLNFTLLLTIFFMILIGMFVGLVLLALNIQRLLEILMVYIFLFYEKTSTRILVLKNLVAHKQRNKMTVAIYAMSIGFLIMIIVAYNLEISNSKIQKLMLSGSYMDLKVSNEYITPQLIEPSLKDVEKYIDSHAWETQDIAKWYDDLAVNSIFASDELTLIQVPCHVFGVSPLYTKTLMSQYVVLDNSNGTSALDLTEQLYTARGIQGSAVSGNTMNKLSISPSKWKSPYKLNVFTDEWNIFLRLRALWSTKFFPGKIMSDRVSSAWNDALISMPTFKKLMGMTQNFNAFPFNRLLIKFKNPGNSDEVEAVTKRLEEATTSYNVKITNSQTDDGSFDTALYILNMIFSIIIIAVMFLCFFSLSSSMSSNMLEQKKEIGVLRAIGLRKLRIYFLYMYE